MNTRTLNRQVTFLTNEQLTRLRKISATTGAAVSTLIRMAVAEYLKKQK